MAVNHYFKVFSNDGSTTLFTSANTVNNSTIITVTETGLTIGTETYTYSGTKKFVGVSGSANTTSPAHAIGESLNGAWESVYIVEEEPTTSEVTIEYNGSVIATIPNGKMATVSCNGKKMTTDVIIEVPMTTDSPIPTEVSTEAEMNTLLSSGEVGGVYKYTGETTDAYENGVLYVLEVELGTFTYAQTDGWYSTPIVRQFPLGMTWAEFISSEYNAIAQDGEGDYAVIGQFIIRDDGQVMFSGDNVNSTNALTLAVYYNSSYTLVYGADVILDEGIYDSTHPGSGGSN